MKNSLGGVLLAQFSVASTIHTFQRVTWEVKGANFFSSSCERSFDIWDVAVLGETHHTTGEDMPYDPWDNATLLQRATTVVSSPRSCLCWGMCPPERVSQGFLAGNLTLRKHQTEKDPRKGAILAISFPTLRHF